MKNIVLIGFMGSGKTVISGVLARKTKRTIVDTDNLIEQTAGMRIKRIFAMYGEPYFRKLESKAAAEAAKADGAIIATGGGIVTKQSNITVLKENGAVVYLKNSFEVSAKRLKKQTDRPLFDSANLEKTRALFNKRRIMYSAAADLTVLTEKKTINQVADEIIKKGGKKGWL